MWKCDRVVRIKRTCHYHFLSFFFFFFFFGSFAGRDEDEEDDEDDDVNDEDDEDDDGDDEDDEDDEDGGSGVNVRSFGKSSVNSPKPEARTCSWKDNAGWFGSGSAGGTISNDGSAGGTISNDVLRCCGAAVDGVGDDCCVDFLFCGCDEDGASVESDSLLRLRVDGCRVSPNMKRGIEACMRSSRSSPSAMSSR